MPHGRAVVLGREDASGRRSDAQYIEIISGYQFHIDLLGGAPVLQAPRSGEARGHPTEDLAMVAKIQVLGVREGQLAAFMAIHSGIDALAVEDYQARRILYREVTQDDLI